MLSQPLPFFIRDRFPVQIKIVDEGPSLLAVVLLETEFEQHRFRAHEAPAQVLRSCKGKTENEMRVMVLLPLILELLTDNARGRRRVRRKREVFLEQGLYVRFRFRGGLVAV